MQIRLTKENTEDMQELTAKTHHSIAKQVNLIVSDYSKLMHLRRHVKINQGSKKK